MAKDITNLEQMLDLIQQSPVENGRVSLGSIFQTVGDRSFGPMLLVCGVLMASPLSSIPGMPTTTGLLVLLVGIQLFFRRDCFWLPKWLLNRSVSQERMLKAMSWLRPIARFIDRLLRPRLPVLIRGVSIYLIATACVVIAAGTPLMELVPFTIHGAGFVVTGFGLSLIARDGLLALIDFLITSIAFGLAVYHLL